MNTVKLYLRSMAMLLRSQWQYPASFCMQTLSQIVMELGEMLAVVLLIDRFGALNQWSGGNLLFFFGQMSITFYLTETFGRGITGAFPSLVRMGQLDTFLLRPRGVLTQVLCSAVDPRRIGCIAVGVTALVLGCQQSPVVWTAAKAVAFGESVLFGGMLVLGLFLIEAIFCIHAVKSVEVVNALTYGGRSTCEYPIDIYPRPFQVLFTLVAPFGLTLHVPAAFILDKPLYGWPQWTVFLCPLAGALLFFLVYALFRKALTHYRSTGS